MKKILALTLLSISSYIGAAIHLDLEYRANNEVLQKNGMVLVDGGFKEQIGDLCFEMEVIEETEETVEIHMAWYEKENLLREVSLNLAWDEPAELLMSEHCSSDIQILVTAHKTEA